MRSSHCHFQATAFQAFFHTWCRPSCFLLFDDTMTLALLLEPADHAATREALYKSQYDFPEKGSWIGLHMSLCTIELHASLCFGKEAPPAYALMQLTHLSAWLFRSFGFLFFRPLIAVCCQLSCGKGPGTLWCFISRRFLPNPTHRHFLAQMLALLWF